MVELRLMCPEARVETLCEALDALDALSVSVEDADAQTDAEQALFGEPGMPPPKEGWQRSRVVALFASQETAQETGKLLALQDFFQGCELLGIQAVAEQDWVRLTQSQFAPVDITPTFWIVPTWHEPPAQAQKNHSPRPRLGLWHGHASNHAHVFALDCHPRCVTSTGARLRLWLGHPGHWCRFAWCN